MSHLKGRELTTVYLHPGEVCFSRKPRKVITVLGSCVSVTMFSPRLKIGAICHGTLPRCRSRKECQSVCIEAFKFMDCAIYFMLDKFVECGVAHNETEIKIFGGADTLMSKSSSSIGRQNIKITLDIMGREKLRVKAADVGDNFGRKLIFFSHTGEVFLKRLVNPYDGGNGKGRTG
jgi:chemotaxis protein CheD